MERKELINKRFKNIIYLILIVLVMILVLTTSIFVKNSILMIMLYAVFSKCLIFMVPFMYDIYELSQQIKFLKGE